MEVAGRRQRLKLAAGGQWQQCLLTILKQRDECPPQKQTVMLSMD